MTKIVTLSGTQFKLEEHSAVVGLSDLKEFIAKIESGEYVDCQWMLVYSRENPDDTSGVLTHSLDNNLTLCEAVYMLSGAIHNIHEGALE